MKRAIIVVGALLACAGLQAQDAGMDKMWGGSDAVAKEMKASKQAERFEQGNYAMFVHWGLYSQAANKWKGKTYYGASEWLMHKSMAGIPVAEYMALANDFNPTRFDARAIARLAKEAGMKYIVVTAKHHDGFAMYDSKVCDFNIVKRTPFAKDPMRALAEACREAGLGFGFYYSHNQDWTYPGGNGGPTTDAAGRSKTFDDYFREKCLPQVEELTRNYGEIQLIWFDTPGNMPAKYAEKLVEVVRANQPGALVSGRVGYGMGDYQTLGDMEIPLKNIEGMWESIDVTNDSWGYAWYDCNWKSAKQILTSLISTVARGGTYMMNVGPTPSGTIPAEAERALRTAGDWIARHPYAIYGAGASPWGHALPWGDATVGRDALYLLVYDWPAGGKLYVPGLQTEVEAARLVTGGKERKLKCTRTGSLLEVELPFERPDRLVSVVKLKLAKGAAAKVDGTLFVDPELGLTASTLFAEVTGGKCRKHTWMEKFGEWKNAFVVDCPDDGTLTTWEVEVKNPGTYRIDLCYTGESRIVWQVEGDEGAAIQNEQTAAAVFTSHPIGWLRFEKAGKHRVSVRALEGRKARLKSITFVPIDF